MSSKLLFDSKPLVVSPELAVLVGLNEAIVLQQIHYWLEIKKNADKKGTEKIEGKYWIYNTYTEWQEQFPFWSISTIKRAISRLEKIGIIVSKNMNRKNYDNTKWYTIDYEKLYKLSDKKSEKNTQKEPENLEMTEWIKMSYSDGSKRSVNVAQNEPTNTRDYYIDNTIINTTTTLDTNISKKTRNQTKQQKRNNVVVDKPESINDLKPTEEEIKTIKEFTKAKGVNLSRSNVIELCKLAEGDKERIENGILAAIEYATGTKVRDMWALIKQAVAEGRIPAPDLISHAQKQGSEVEDKYKYLYLS